MIAVFEGPLCCNTGVCGTDPDQDLVTFTADVAWLARHGVEVRRANLAQDPQAFAESEVARAYLRTDGADGLPLVVVDGVTVCTGRYPTRVELARVAGLPTEKPSSSCCSDTESAAPCCQGKPESIEITQFAVSTPPGEHR